MEKKRHRGVERADRSGVEKEERRGERVRGEIKSREWWVAKRLRGELMQ